ncbi:molecular chaperone [Burkholderia diffusa]|uniref:fimbrial biogenesis chaperone n=1 Tax=Burkholderia diffusa TaxID=488732 RepID=UPI00075ECDAD|nr:molecular chaperone [Burkholderia diffusa]KVC48827.1 pilus assembly protein [Burkholderia diffusa]
MKAKRFAAGVALACALASASHASISLNATRVIFDGNNKESSLLVKNDGADILIQSWLDPLDDADMTLPFAITPPLAKVEAGQQQLLRVMYEGAGMPTDRESAFWLSVQEIPLEANGSNVLQLAVRQSVKVFYRPVGLSGDPEKAPESLRWNLGVEAGNSVLRLSNPSLYHVTVVDAMLRSGHATEPVVDARMIAPGATLTLPIRLPTGNASAPELRYEIINDFGGREAYRVILHTHQPSRPIPVRN